MQEHFVDFQPGEGGVENVEVNYEGSIEGSGASGTVLGTLNVTPNADATNGTWIWCGREFAADGATRMAMGGAFSSRLVQTVGTCVAISTFLTGRTLLRKA